LARRKAFGAIAGRQNREAKPRQRYRAVGTTGKPAEFLDYPMALIQYSVQLVGKSNVKASGMFLIVGDETGGTARLILQAPDGEVAGEGTDFFEAMCQIRDQLEPPGKNHGFGVDLRVGS
jgi:hypothetical protein